MFCQKCGKEISDQAKFCNFCGNQVSQPQSQTPPVQPQTPPSRPKKKTNVKRILIYIVVVVVVYTASKFIAGNVVAGKQKAADTMTNTGYIELVEPTGSTSSAAAPVDTANSELSAAMAKCGNGALYQNDYLRYGPTRLYVPGYSLLAGEDGGRDWLINPDGACLVGTYKQPEVIEISYEASNEADMLQSFERTYGKAFMHSYEKYYVNGYPVIRYIVDYETDDVRQMHGELIVFPSETTKETVRLAVFVDLSTGYYTEAIDEIFDTLEISPEFAPGSDETGVMGLNRIAAK